MKLGKKVIAALLSLGMLPALAAPLRVMPLGDSITESVGWYAGSGYRAVLRKALVDAGYEIDMVGSSRSRSAGFSNAAISGSVVTDCEHEGHGGWTINEIRSQLPLWFRTVEDPHVILLLIGTNDFQRDNTDEVPSRYEALLDELYAYQPSAKVIAATILPCTYENNDGYNVSAFNEGLATLVAKQVAKGQSVTLLDMHSKVTLDGSDTDDFDWDNLHPNEQGYRKMAAAWYEAISALFTAGVDPAENALALVDKEFGRDRKSVTLYFNKQVGSAADDIANYTVTGFTPSSVSVASNRRSVTLSCADMIPAGVSHTIQIAGVGTFAARYDATGALNNVDEASLYRLAWSLNIPVGGGWAIRTPHYDIDNRADLGPFTRVAYYMELEDHSGNVTYCWVSMDTDRFTSDPRLIGIPTCATSGRGFNWDGTVVAADDDRTYVYGPTITNLHIRSNNSTLGSQNVADGKLYFFATGYDYNQGKPFESYNTKYEGYGSMQICSGEADAIPVISFNGWGWSGVRERFDIGIGPSATGNSDYTWAENADQYRRRLLQAYVLEDATAAADAPQVLSAGPTVAGNKVIVRFDRPVAESENFATAFAIADGPSVLAAEVYALDPREVVLTLANKIEPSTNPLTLSFTGVAADLPSRPAASGSVSLATAYLPSEVADHVSAAATADYRFVYAADLPHGCDWQSANDIYAYYDRVYREYNRLAYYMETISLDGATTNWVWVSMDKLSAAAGTQTAELAIPYYPEGTRGWHGLSNIEIETNVGNITTVPAASGSSGVGGVAEFYSSNFDANGGYNDTGWSDSAGYGCMQVFSGAVDGGQVIFCFSGWGGGRTTMDCGIGANNTGAGYWDWTFAENADKYSRRRLYAFARPVSAIVPDSGTGSSDQPLHVTVNAKRDKIAVSFTNDAVLAALDVKAYAIDGTAPVSACLSAIDSRDVILTLASPLSAEGAHTLTTKFSSGDVVYSLQMPREASAQIQAGVPELGDYVLVNDLTVGASVNYSYYGPDYRTDLSRFTGAIAFDRIAYAMELQDSSTGVSKWIWVSMDAFTDDLRMVGVPCVRTGGLIAQQEVANLHVYAGSSDNSHASLPSGNLAAGLIEFTYMNYSADNYAGVFGSSDSEYDWGDNLKFPDNYNPGYGSMQIHDSSSKQVLMSLSGFGNNDANSVVTPCLCIGNNTSGVGSVDGTFLQNAGNLAVRDLRVYVRPKARKRGLCVMFY